MTPFTIRMVTLYLALLLGLTALGAFNQNLYQQQRALLKAKTALQLELSDARSRASNVSGRLAVRKWAYARGMVPATQAKRTDQVVTTPPPILPLPPTGLEMRTLWR